MLFFKSYIPCYALKKKLQVAETIWGIIAAKRRNNSPQFILRSSFLEAVGDDPRCPCTVRRPLLPVKLFSRAHVVWAYSGFACTGNP